MPATSSSTGATNRTRLCDCLVIISNLLESPTLVYAACLAEMVSDQSTLLLQSLAWIFVFARCVHSYIHLGHNKVQYRVTAYFVSWFVLVGMWIYLAT